MDTTIHNSKRDKLLDLVDIEIEDNNIHQIKADAIQPTEMIIDANGGFIIPPFLYLFTLRLWEDMKAIKD